MDIKIKKEYIIQKKSTTKAGQITVYWCKYGKMRGFSCPVKFKVVRKDEKVFILDDKNSKGHDHAEVEGERIYHHNSDDQVEAMKENIELDVATQNIRKSLKNKVNQIKKELQKDQVFLKFKRLVTKHLILG